MGPRTSEDRCSFWWIRTPFCQPGPAGGNGPRIGAVLRPERQIVNQYAGCSIRVQLSGKRSETMIQVPAVIERCAGIDIGKREIAAAVITGPADQDGEVKTRAFATTVPALEALRSGSLRRLLQRRDGKYGILRDSGQERSGNKRRDCPRVPADSEAAARRQDGFPRC